MSPRAKRPGVMVKTTLVFNEEILISAKQAAIGRKISLSEMVEMLLLKELNMTKETGKKTTS